MLTKAAILVISLFIGITSYFSYFAVLHDDEPNYPMLLWWTDFDLKPNEITCKDGKKCIVAGHLGMTHTDNLQAVLFYGSLMNVSKMPTHNLNNHNVFWALYHEESPKNQPALTNVNLQQMFNITATYSRLSTFPVTYQYLETLDLLTSHDAFVSIEEKNALVRKDGLAPILYMQSSCDNPIKRDSYVEELMKHITIDSYGHCLNNKKLPANLSIESKTLTLFSQEIMQLTAKYKFVIAIENAECVDYVTEKLWRPLIVGSIPIYMGATNIKDYLPNDKSAILIGDFPSIESLAKYVLKVNSNDDLYNSYLDHKLHQTITNPRLLNAFESGGSFGLPHTFSHVILAFECFVCEATASILGIRLGIIVGNWVLRKLINLLQTIELFPSSDGMVSTRRSLRCRGCYRDGYNYVQTMKLSTNAIRKVAKLDSQLVYPKW